MKEANMRWKGRRNGMSKTLLLSVGEDIAILENEICEYRRKHRKNLAPSAFSYQLYELKLAFLRNEAVT